MYAKIYLYLKKTGEIFRKFNLQTILSMQHSLNHYNLISNTHSTYTELYTFNQDFINVSLSPGELSDINDILQRCMSGTTDDDDDDKSGE